MSEIQNRGGEFADPELQGERIVLGGIVPSARFIDFPAQFNVLTSGQGLITIQFSHYDQCQNQNVILNELSTTNISGDKQEDMLYNSVSLFREKRKMKKVKGDNL